eukprot:CAMPEP_0119522606 /NCGR_PEP_ID=MMETSP1344-20130328/37890_1 /TAXON_ID=236787 /ORGANISM="Florenciella parvula, Strain CCMP2471" /LENGTH=243 /DNA_ID=CAMNT_0007560653 /DNA_START=22 /DNA_END=753 /DNA_ORIENTATION=+
MTSLLQIILMLSLPAAARGHASCTTNEMTTSDKYMSTSIRIGHACGYDGGTGTTKVVITFPQFDDWAITSIRGGMMWNWNYSYTTRNIESLGYTSHGSAVSTTVDTITFIADKPMTDELYADFPIKFKLADTSGSFPLSVGDKLYIPTMQHCTNNTFRDWANETDTEGAYMPYITVVDDDSDDDGDDDDTSSERKSAAAVLMGACALALSTVVLMTLVWLVLAVQDLKLQIGTVPTADLNNKL